VSLVVNNLPPTASISGPTSGKKNKSLAFKLYATDISSADQSAGFKYSIDWNGDGVIDQVVNGAIGISVNHTFAAATYTVKMFATDKDGGNSSVVSLVLKIT